MGPIALFIRCINESFESKMTIDVINLTINWFDSHYVWQVNTYD